MSAYKFEWVTAVPVGSEASGNDFAYEVLKVVRPGITRDYASVFGVSYMTADGDNPTHSVATIVASDVMRGKALELLGSGAYPSLMFRVVPDVGVQPGDPPYYVADKETAWASMGLEPLPTTTGDPLSNPI